MGMTNMLCSPDLVAVIPTVILTEVGLPACRAPPGKRTLKICGVQRIAVVAVFLSIGLLLLYYSAAHLTILWATLTGRAACMDPSLLCPPFALLPLSSMFADAGGAM